MTVAHAPRVSAKAMIAPPCRIDGVVHSSGLTSISATTRSAVALTKCTPRSFENGGSLSSNIEILSRLSVINLSSLFRLRLNAAVTSSAFRKGVMVCVEDVLRKTDELHKVDIAARAQ